MPRGCPTYTITSSATSSTLGDDFDADMQTMAADEGTQRWWAACKPLLTPVVDLPPDEVWAQTEEVFHTE